MDGGQQIRVISEERNDEAQQLNIEVGFRPQ
jgi:hypothetical protein